MKLIKLLIALASLLFIGGCFLITKPPNTYRNQIVDFGVCGDWIIVSAGHYEGSGQYFVGDFYRIKKGGGEPERMNLTDDDEFVIAEDWIYYDFWRNTETVASDKGEKTGCYRIRPDGTGKEYLGDTLYRVILYAQDGYLYGEQKVKPKLSGVPVTNLIRCNLDGTEIATLFSGDSLPFTGDSNYIEYADICVSDDCITFTAMVHGLSHDDGWRGHCEFIAQYQTDKHGKNLTLLKELTENEFMEYIALYSKLK